MAASIQIELEMKTVQAGFFKMAEMLTYDIADGDKSVHLFAQIKFGLDLVFATVLANDPRNTGPQVYLAISRLLLLISLVAQGDVSRKINIEMIGRLSSFEIKRLRLVCETLFGLVPLPFYADRYFFVLEFKQLQKSEHLAKRYDRPTLTSCLFGTDMLHDSLTNLIIHRNLLEIEKQLVMTDFRS